MNFYKKNLPFVKLDKITSKKNAERNDYLSFLLKQTFGSDRPSSVKLILQKATLLLFFEKWLNSNNNGSKE